MKREELHQLPIYQKAEEIVKITEALMNTIPEDKSILLKIKSQLMMEDAYAILAKIAGVEGVELYDMKMENAAIIRKSARELYVTAGSIRYEPDFKDSEYVELLRTSIDEFRLLFIDWVATFNPWDYIIDRWGLFNPPGVTAHDIDPDDDIPFNIEDFFNDDDE